MHILFTSEYYPPIIMGGGEINLATLAQALSNTKDIKISILTSSAPNLPEIETPPTHPNLTIYRHLRTGSSPSSLFGNLFRLLFLKRSILTQTKKLLQQQNHPLDIIHFIGGTIIAAKKLKTHLHHQSHPIPLFATIESYPTLCPKGDRWYKQKEPCTVKCTLPTFLTCQSNCSEIGKMKNAWYLKYNPLFLLLTYHYYNQRNTALSHCNLIAISKYVQNLLAQQKHQSTIIPNILDITPFEQAKKETKIKDQQNQPPLQLLYSPPSGFSDVGKSPRRTILSAGKFGTLVTEQESNCRPNKQVGLLYLGSLIESKGPHIILQSLKDLPPASYHLDLYGNGIMKHKLQQYITNHNLNATIHPHTPFEQIPTIYANADIILFPSLWPEPFGRIPIEAHAANKIVIASNIGAIPETVNENDILVPANNPSALTQTITNIINERENNKSFKQPSNKTKEHKETNYLPQTIVTKIQQTYKNAINNQEKQTP